MLVEVLAKLADRIGAERISVEIPPSDGGEISVMVVTSLGHSGKSIEDEEVGPIVEVLARPLVVKGNVGEIESRVVAMIDSLDDELAGAAKSLPETDVQRRKREIREAAEKKDEGGKKKGSDGKESKAARTKTATKSDEAHAEALASGEADSL